MVAAAVQTAFVAAKPVQARQSRSRVVRVAAVQQGEQEPNQSCWCGQGPRWRWGLVPGALA